MRKVTRKPKARKRLDTPPSCPICGKDLELGIRMLGVRAAHKHAAEHVDAGLAAVADSTRALVEKIPKCPESDRVRRAYRDMQRMARLSTKWEARIAKRWSHGCLR